MIFSTFTRLVAGVACCFFLIVGLLPTARAQAPTPAWQWAVRGASPGAPAAQSQANRLCVDAAGNTYVLGHFTTTLALGAFTLASPTTMGGYLAKYTPAGSVAWVRQLGSPSGGLYMYRVATDGAGNVYLTGVFEDELTIGSYVLPDPNNIPGGAGGPNGFVAKLDPQGSVVWAARIGPVPNAFGGGATCNGLAVDASGTVTIAGYLSGTVSVAGQAVPVSSGFQAYFYVARLTATGTASPTLAWVRTAEAPQIRFDTALALDAAGDVYAALSNTGGMTFGGHALPGTGTAWQSMLVKYDASGTAQWAVRLPEVLPAGTATLTNVADVAAPATGAVYVATHASASAPNYQRGLLLAQYSAQGAAGWQHTTVGSSSATGIGSLALDAAANLYVAGGFDTSFTLGGAALSSSPSTATDAYLLSFTPQGSLRYGLPISNGAGVEVISSLAVSPPETVHVAGAARGDAQLGPIALPATSTAYQLLIGRLQLRTTTAAQPASASALLLAPNPAHGTALLTLPAAPIPQPLALLDALARPVRHYTVPAGATTAQLNVAGLPAGLYVLRGAGASRKLVLE
ncbi:SBBP repeat-containing protein [Hymenobacter sp. ASUV-10]|uniref:SBBP repeat-containing protein n=1 Tax=Hymenobacter aranciens TaxID=3063996 RepID=A0ABT9B793_9BACT|nr:SBBP repeat-containing protein [Hymenobacter sp. ASUV-10]MDO7874144.1 SBBP repeat-containing protein [Hymenobacter sp. ASUV-10]